MTKYWELIWEVKSEEELNSILHRKTLQNELIIRISVLKIIESIATALNTSTPELISAAYKNQPDNIENNKSKFYFLDKLNITIKKLPQKEAEEVSKHLFYVINDLTK